MRPYRTVVISVYEDDLELIDKTVKLLKKRGFARANRSSLLRGAFRIADVDALLERMVAEATEKKEQQ